MPAIRFRYHYGKPIATQAPAEKPIELFMADGSLKRAGFAGFICKYGIEMVPGQIAKMAATMVTNGNPISGEWRDVGKDECVLVYVVDRFDDIKANLPLCYGIVDRHGWPIVVQSNRPEPPATTPAEIIQLKSA